MNFMAIININSNLIKILSNYLGKIWSLLSVFIFVPVYIKFLGVENYAIIGFYSLILALISFADAGMSSAITREFSLDKNNLYKLSILKKIEKIYWLVLTFICILIFLSSGVIAKKWLTSENIIYYDLKNYVILIGIGTCIQMISSIYFGALFGLGKQVKANNFQIIWTTARSVFVVILFIIFKPSLYVFLIWQIFCNIIYVTLLRYSVIKDLNIGLTEIKNLTNKIPPEIIKYIGGMTIVAIISAINSQADKLIISYFYSLKTFGYYTMVSTLSQIPVFITMPMASFIFPLLTKFSENKEYYENFEIVFKKFVFLLYLIIIPVSILFCFFPVEIFSLWIKTTFDIDFLSKLPILSCTLILGSLFLAMQFPFYYTLLANSQTKYTVYQGIVQVFFGVPILYFFAKSGDLKYVGLSWFLINFCSFVYLMYICFKYYLRFKSIYFVKKYIITPVLISILIGILGHYLYLQTNIKFYFIFIPATISSFFLVLIIDNFFENRSYFSFKHLYDFPRG